MLEVRHFSFDDNDLGEPYSFPNSLIPITYEELKNNYRQPNYIAFDGLGIDLTDDNKVFYNYEYAGFIGSDACDQNGFCYLHLSFSVPENCPESITFVFYGNCCKSVSVAYNIGTRTLHKESVYPNNNIATITINPTSENSDERAELIDFYFESALPYQLIKIQSIVFGKVNTFKKIRSYSMLEEINILSSDLPINSFECEVVTDEEFNEDEPLNIYSNNTYYGTFFIYEIERTQKKAYLLKCYSPLFFADKVDFYGWDYMECATIDFLNSLSKTCGIEISSLSSKNLEEKDDSVETTEKHLYRMFGCIPIKSVRYCLCAAAFVNCMMVFTSRDYGIRLKDIPTNITSVINSNRILGEATFKKSKTISEAIWQYPISYEETDKTLNIIAETGKSINFIFDKPTLVNHNDIDELQVNSISLNHIDFIPVNDETTISALELTFTNTEVKIANPTITAKTKNNTVSFKDFSLCGEYAYFGIIDKSPDIQKYISSRGTVSAKIILNGEKVGDLVTIETELDGMITGIITSMAPKFGYRDTAEIEVYEWPVG